MLLRIEKSVIDPFVESNAAEITKVCKQNCVCFYVYKSFVRANRKFTGDEQCRIYFIGAVRLFVKTRGGGGWIPAASEGPVAGSFSCPRDRTKIALCTLSARRMV
jgi:hypothetical protein